MPLVLDGTTGFSGGGGVATSTALGSSALITNSTGTNIVAIGYQAGYFTTAGPNVFVGSQAGYTNSTGTNNIGIGRQALYLNTTAANNTAVGYQAGYSNTTGSENTSIGTEAGKGITTGTFNIAVGFRPMDTGVVTGTENTAVGRAGLRNLSTGNYNTALGAQALLSNTTASNNVAIGYQALYSYQTGGDNVAIGAQAGYTLNGNGNSVFVGGSSGQNTTGGNQTFVGYQSGANVTTGTGNLCLGYQAGANATNLTTGTQNILIGFQTNPSAGAVNYEIVMTTRGGSGKGTTTGYIDPQGGGVYQGNNSANWSTTSDRRLKKNIVDNNVGLTAITQVRIRNFEYKLPEEVTELGQGCAISNTGVQLGVIAQELQEVLPNCVKTESTGVMSVDSSNLTWHMINAIKELKTIVDAQSALITGQAAEIVALKAKVGL